MLVILVKVWPEMIAKCDTTTFNKRAVLGDVKALFLLFGFVSIFQKSFIP